MVLTLALSRGEKSQSPQDAGATGSLQHTLVEAIPEMCTETRIIATLMAKSATAKHENSCSAGILPVFIRGFS
jgi:hypothetical protein